ncbi:glucosylceramidase [Camponotus floridanus]|uniref:glucosylceramidase n=1 Tax=Camponotus floridanus TaxID=104421 RepID=UPI000DC6B5AD|nr:glucosylceramidase [Camponotus floridanus]
MWRLIILVAVLVTVTLSDCNIKRRSTTSGDDGHYCVCNAQQCDQTPDVIKPTNLDEYTLITSNKNGLRFRESKGIFKNVNSDYCQLGKITVNQTDMYQKIFGFGGAMTDSAAINILNLTHNTSDNLLKSYFGPHGINYNFIRMPMGGTDFSTRPYTYAMIENDVLLSDFDLQPEDYNYKIPLTKRAQELKENEIKLLTVPWTASPWMKTKYSWTSNAKLRPEYRQLWANYFVKYFEAYRNAGLEFWGVSSQNEPVSYLYAPNINGMVWTAEEERDWIIEYLSPTLKKNGFEHIKIFIMEENRLTLPDWPKKVFKDQRVRDIVSGVTVHFYFDKKVRSHTLTEIKRNFPEKLIMYTEACTGVDKENGVILGSWIRGEVYAKNIIENMRHWVSSWIDWNIALDMTGGPNWVNNFVDSPIIVNNKRDEFYKQPMFYALGHFSKYVPPNSKRIGSTMGNMKGIKNVAFSTPDGGVALIILNLNEEEKAILIEDPKKGTTTINVSGRSINTIKYWNI